MRIKEMSFKQFAEEVKSQGLRPRECSPMHWRIEGGLLGVNVYPTTGRIHINGTNKGKFCKTITDACNAAKTAPERVSKFDRAKRKSSNDRIKRLRKKLWEKQNHKCKFCPKILKLDETTLEHVIPFARGGSESMDNLAVSCHECNQARADNMPELKDQRVCVFCLKPTMPHNATLFFYHNGIEYCDDDQCVCKDCSAENLTFDPKHCTEVLKDATKFPMMVKIHPKSERLV